MKRGIGRLGTAARLAGSFGEVNYFRLETLASLSANSLDRFPYTVLILLENLLRQAELGSVEWETVQALAGWQPDKIENVEFPFMPGRVLAQDLTGVPLVVDLAAMRAAVHRGGGDARLVNPLVPVDLVIDHSIQADYFGSEEALAMNVACEYARNRERYLFLRWAQAAFENFRVVPPGTGIVHQVNLEHLARVVQTSKGQNGETWASPDTLVGTDSHTPTVNGLGVLGWGVGGIEAEAALLGQPMYLLTPEVVGVRLLGRLPPGVLATDLALHLTDFLRREGVVGKYVEFTGPGVKDLEVPDRATVANMAPEYGATSALFPVDEETLRYLRLTGREEALVDLVERYCKEQGLFRSENALEPRFSRLLEFDLGCVEPSLAGPRRPQDRVSLAGLKSSFESTFPAVATKSTASGLLNSGAVVLAAITSCTNTANPSVMLAAGLLAKKAVERGLRVPAHVKTTLSPGSRAVMGYLEDAGLLPYLQRLGFALVGFGCMTCIGNSGPLVDWVEEEVRERNLTVSAVLSGNRNFEGRIHPQVRAAYLASPPLVVAYALAGTVAIDLEHEPLGLGTDGKPVHLRDIWPSAEEIAEARRHAIRHETFISAYEDVFAGDERWRSLPIPSGDLYDWDPASTYVREPPFFRELTLEPEPLTDILGARVLVLLGDSVTTDHISPAGSIPAQSPAARYLTGQGVAAADFNSYGARRGNHEVMVRGTFGNSRLRNALLPDREGPWTLHLPSGEVTSIYEASMRYQAQGVPLLVIGGKEYGCGSSRDWAAKGPRLLGVRAVLAQSFERIHRSNLVGMGVLPLQFLPGQSAATLGLTGREVYDLVGIGAGLSPRQELTIRARRDDGSFVEFGVLSRLDSLTDVEYYRHGGVLPMMVRRLMRESRESQRP